MTNQIKFTIGNIAEGYKTVEIFIKGDTASYKILRDGLLNVDKKISSAVKVSDEWLAQLDALKIFDWEKNYSSEVPNGEQWELIFKDGGKIYRGQGVNAYPKDFERFLDLLDVIVPELEFVNRKRLEKITLNYSRRSAIGYDVSEQMTLDRHEKTLTLDKKNAYTFAKHIYCLGSAEEKLFDAAQKFFDALEIQSVNDAPSPKIIIELVESTYNELCLPGLTKFIDVIRGFITDLTAEIFLLTPAEIISTSDKYIFCKVQFKGSYKHYTYQADDETLAVGDVVDVPVGKNNDVAQARIVEIGYFDEYEAPFPIDKIKKIIGKHTADDWENY